MDLALCVEGVLQCSESAEARSLGRLSRRIPEESHLLCLRNH